MSIMVQRCHISHKYMKSFVSSSIPIRFEHVIYRFDGNKSALIIMSLKRSLKYLKLHQKHQTTRKSIVAYKNGPKYA